MWIEDAVAKDAERVNGRWSRVERSGSTATYCQATSRYPRVRCGSWAGQQQPPLLYGVHPP